MTYLPFLFACLILFYSCSASYPSEVVAAETPCNGSSRGIFLLEFNGKVDRLLKDADGRDIEGEHFRNQYRPATGVSVVAVVVTVEEIREARTYNSISLAPGDLLAYKGKKVVINNVGQSSTLREGEKLSFRILGMMNYGAPIVANLTYYYPRPPDGNNVVTSDVVLTYPISEVGDPVFGNLAISGGMDSDRQGVPGKSRYKSIGELAEDVMKSVVRIDATGIVKVRGRELPYQETGTGFIIDGRGYVLTNSHVVDKYEWVGEPDIRLQFNWDRGGSGSLSVSAKRVASRRDFDLAVLRVDPSDKAFDRARDYLRRSSKELYALDFTYSTGVGEEVVAVGFGAGPSATPRSPGELSAPFQGQRRMGSSPT